MPGHDLLSTTAGPLRPDWICSQCFCTGCCHPPNPRWDEQCLMCQDKALRGPQHGVDPVGPCLQLQAQPCYLKEIGGRLNFVGEAQ